MSARDRGKTSILIDPDSWLAGVLDSGGTFDLWFSQTSRRWCWRVGIRFTDIRAAFKFEDLAGVRLRQIGTNRYVLVASDALPLLSRVMPRMFCLHEKAGVLYRYLLTRPGRKGMRGAMTKAVDAYRHTMVARLRAQETAHQSMRRTYE